MSETCFSIAETAPQSSQSKKFPGRKPRFLFVILLNFLIFIIKNDYSSDKSPYLKEIQLDLHPKLMQIIEKLEEILQKSTNFQEFESTTSLFDSNSTNYLTDRSTEEYIEKLLQKTQQKLSNSQTNNTNQLEVDGKSETYRDFHEIYKKYQQELSKMTVPPEEKIDSDEEKPAFTSQNLTTTGF